MSRQSSHAQFFFQLSDVGMSLRYTPLVTNALAILKIMPADQETIRRIKEACSRVTEGPDDSCSSRFDSLFFIHSSPTQVAYTLGVIYSLLMPAQNPLSQEAQEFQFTFFRSGCGFKVMELLTRNNFLSQSDDYSKICTYHVVLKITKLVLVTLAHYICLTSDIIATERTILLQQALSQIPNPSGDCTIRDVAQKVALGLKASGRSVKNLCLPEKNVISAVLLIAWATATGQEDEGLLQAPPQNIRDMIRQKKTGKEQIYATCREALEVMTIMFMLSPEILSQFSAESSDFSKFITDLLLISPEGYVTCPFKCYSAFTNALFYSMIRETALEQFALMPTKCSLAQDVLINFIQLLHSHLGSTVASYYETSNEFFQLFCRLLNSASVLKCSLPLTQELLEYEVDLIQNVRVCYSFVVVWISVLII